MSWLVLAFISILSLSAANVLQRVLMKDDQSDAMAYAIVFQLLGAAVVAVFAVYRGFVWPPIAQIWPYMLLSGGLYATGTYAVFRALKKTEASEVAILTASRALITVASAILFLGESFSWQKAVGTILILAAVVLVSKKPQRVAIDEGLWLAIIMAFAYGLAITVDTFILRYAEPVSFTVFGFLVPGLILLAIQPQSMRKIPAFFEWQTLKNMLIMSIFYGIAAIAFYSALDAGANASQLGPINQASVIVTVILAAIFLQERGRLLPKLMAAGLVCSGVLLLR